MSEPLLQVEGLRVEYDDVTAVDDVSFSVDAGMVYGLAGPNGAGKTSTIRAIASLVEPTWGRIRVGGIDLAEDPRGALARIGFMPDFPPLYEDLTVAEFLALYASAYGLRADIRAARIDAVIAQVSLDGKREAMCGTLSRGMRRRLFLAKTLLHDPDVVLLDEPASGLDPQARMELRGIMVDLGRRGKAVLVSSHILSEMSGFCNAVGVMERGRMIVSGRIEDVLAIVRPARESRVRRAEPDDRLPGHLGAVATVRVGSADARCAGFQVPIEAGGEDAADGVAADVLAGLVAAGFRVADFREEARTLEDIYRRVSSGSVS